MIRTRLGRQWIILDTAQYPPLVFAAKGRPRRFRALWWIAGWALILALLAALSK